MKKIILSLVFILGIALISTAQMTAPSDPGSGPEAGDDPIGGGAPIGGGSIILIGLAATYGGKKIYDYRKNMEELED